jgi:acid phosphatase/acid phosphatase (class A)
VDFLKNRGESIDMKDCRELWENSTNQQMIDIIKNEVKRSRPYWIDDRIKPTEGTEKFCYSFPSGHAAGARFMAFRLSDKFPNLKGDLLRLSERIANTRIQAGLHFPSDVKAGLALGETFYRISK